MAIIPSSNLNGLPRVTSEDMKNNDPNRLNRTLNLLASQIQSLQTGKTSNTGITNSTTIINKNTNTSGSGGGGGGGSSPSSPIATTVTLQGTHADRLSTYLAPDEPEGCFYYETDRTVLYLNFLTPATIQVWQYVSGTMFSTLALRPVDLGTYDAGFLFYATDQKILYEWSGSVWAQFASSQTVIQDTYANWTTANYPPANYAVGTLFRITDWDVIYVVQVVSAANKWVYGLGAYIAADSARPTTGFNAGALGVNDEGLQFIGTTNFTLEFWNGSAWKLTPPALTDGQVWIGSSGGFPVPKTINSDATLADTGALTLATVNASPGTYTNATVVVNNKGLATSVTSGTGGGPPTGAAGGSLGGYYPDPVVSLLFGTVIEVVPIASLPSPPAAGMVGAVNNALAPVIGAQVTGTGTAFAAVCYNGAQWTVFSV